MRRFVVGAAGLFLFSCSLLFAGIYSGGDGSAGSPYLIHTTDDWEELMATSGDWGGHFKLTADLDMTGIAMTPVGNGGTAFSGVFDGNGHTLNHVLMNLPPDSYIGLFGTVSGLIKNLGIANIDLQGQSAVGGLAGYNDGGLLTGCFVTGTIRGDSTVGGLVGWNDGRITSCYATCSVDGSNRIGGLAGINETLITSSFAAGPVNKSGISGLSIGGVSGQGAGPTINCLWDIQATGQSSSFGGIGLTSEAMQDASTYLKVLWDFRGEVVNGTQDTWAMPVGGGYPILSWQLDSESLLTNDEMAGALSIFEGQTILVYSIEATGLDITANGYRDSRDIWYVFTPTVSDDYTIRAQSTELDPTLGVFDSLGREVVFNDDYFGRDSLVVLKATAGTDYYLRLAGADEQTGQFSLSVTQGAVQAMQGDLNYDGNVNLIDLSLMAGNWMLD